MTTVAFLAFPSISCFWRSLPQLGAMTWSFESLRAECCESDRTPEGCDQNLRRQVWSKSADVSIVSVVRGCGKVLKPAMFQEFVLCQKVRPSLQVSG